MTIITTRDKKGNVTDIIFPNVFIDGRKYTYPQMIDVTDKSPQEIFDLITGYEWNMLKNPPKEDEETRKIRERAEKEWLAQWNS